mmetsp:Transcript_9016/g.30069  ORF Transcript_9016/g.30069 Transcript_9016/m.30069 type:complete len:567 (+) Transcript_9016:235-1935(+)
MAVSLVSTWPPLHLYQVSKLGAFWLLADVWGYITYLVFTGPTHVGETIAGFFLGPMHYNIVPYPEAFAMMGQLGAVYIIFEKGLTSKLDDIVKQFPRSIALANLSLTVSMFWIALVFRLKGHSMTESVCASLAFSIPVCGIVEFGWSKKKLSNLIEGDEIFNETISGSTTIGVMIGMVLLSLLNGTIPLLNEQPVGQWWNILQPLLFSLVFLIGCVVLTLCWNFLCCPPLIQLLAIEKKTDETFKLHESVIMVFMICTGVGCGLAAEVVQVPYIVGVFVGGLSFSKIQSARDIWEKNTKNIGPWLYRIFFSCSLGFLMPNSMGNRGEAISAGIEVSVAGILGTLFGVGMVSFGLMFREKQVISKSILAGLIWGQGSEISYIVLLYFYQNGHIALEGFGSLLWALFLASSICPALSHFTTVLSNFEQPRITEVPMDDEYYQGEIEAVETPQYSHSGNVYSYSLETSHSLTGKAQQFRNDTMKYDTTGALSENQSYTNQNGYAIPRDHYMPKQLTPSPTQTQYSNGFAGGVEPVYYSQNPLGSLAQFPLNPIQTQVKRQVPALWAEDP